MGNSSSNYLPDMILSVTLLTLLSGLFGATVYMATRPQERPVALKPRAGINTQQWKYYESSRAGFSVKYPEIWEAADEKAESTGVSVEFRRGDEASIAVRSGARYSQELRRNYTLTEWAKKSEDAIKEAGQAQIRKSKIKVDDLTATRLVYTDKNNRTIYAIFAQKDPNLYEINVSYDASKASIYGAVVSEIISNFKLLEKSDDLSLKIYSNEKYGFEFSYPKEITLSNGSEKLDFKELSNPTSGKFLFSGGIAALNLSFRVEGRPSRYTDLESYAKKVAKDENELMKKNPPAAPVTVGIEKAKMPGLNGYAVISKSAVATGATDEINYLEKGGNIFSISFSYPADLVNEGSENYNYDEGVKYETIWKIIDSFKFYDETASVRENQAAETVVSGGGTIIYKDPAGEYQYSYDPYYINEKYSKFATGEAPKVTTASYSGKDFPVVCPASGDAVNKISIGTVKIGGADYCFSMSSEGAAGTIHAEYDYVTVKNAKAYTLSFPIVLKGGCGNGDCGAYCGTPAENDCRKFSIADDVEEPIKDVVATFKFTD